MPGEVERRSESAELLEKFFALVARAESAAGSLRKLAAISGLFCLLSCVGLGLYWNEAGGLLFKVALGGILASGAVTVCLLGLAWLVLGRVVSLRDDFADFVDGLLGLLQDDLPAMQNVLDDSGWLFGKIRAMRLLGAIAVKSRSLDHTAKGLTLVLGKAALLGNPVVNFCVLLLIGLGFLLPFCGGLLLVARIWWRARGGG